MTLIYDNDEYSSCDDLVASYSPHTLRARSTCSSYSPS